jgi:anti-sigma regulatory factor (Ser/Thr protein kinase)
MEPFEQSLPANPAVLQGFRQSLSNWLGGAEIGQVAQDALVLAAHGAVANGIEHGSGSPVRVQGTVENGDLVVEITTNGSWGSTSESEDTLAERGRGVALMRGLTELQLRVDDDCVVIRLRPPQP